jgi:predicted Ser/Thr protein kinase
VWEGRVLGGKLRIVRELGRGGMGAVYEVYHERLQIVLALKQIVADLQHNPGIQKRFDQEARMMATLRHPNIVRIYDTDYEPDFGSYILMEFVRGKDLATLLRERGSFDCREALRIGLEVAAALAYAHGQGVVHRDIKPPNILIEDESNRAIVTDFGIAKRIAGEDDTNLSRTDTFVGTYRYSSREQIRHERELPVDGRADLYSLGVVLYELVSGRRYLDGMSELNIASCVGYQDSWRPTLQFPEGVPTALRVLLEQCVEPFRDLRVQSAAELIARMQMCLASPMPAPDLDSGPASEAPTEAPPSEPVLEPPRFVTRATTVTERRAEQRARAVVRLRALRDVIGARSAAFERLVEEGVRLGYAADPEVRVLDLDEDMKEVEQAEDRGDFLAAAEQLEEVGERLREHNERVEDGLAAAVSSRLDELRKRWDRLSERAAGLVDEEEVAGATSALDGVGIALEEREWRMCRRALERVEALLERGSQEAQRRSTEQIERFFSQIEESVGKLAGPSDAPTALPWTVASLRESVAALVARGELAQAIDRAARAWADCELARAALEQAERETLAGAKEACALLRAALERLDAEPDQDISEAEAALAEAARAENAGDLRRAAAAYRRASALLDEIRTRAESRDRAARAAARDELTALLERAAAVSPELIEESRAAAERVLASAETDGLGVAVLRDALERLAKDLHDEPSFAEMTRLAGDVASLRDRLEALARPEELLPLRGALGEAYAARSRREWTTTSERLRAALVLAGALEKELAQRRAEDAVATASEQAGSAVRAVTPITRPELAAEAKDALAKLALAETAARARRYDEAVALHREVFAKAQGLSRKLAALQSADLRALETSLSDLAARSEAVSSDDLREGIRRALGTIDRIPLGESAAEESVAAIRTSLERWEGEGRERALAACRAEHERLVDALSGLSALDAPRPEAAAAAWKEVESRITAGRYGGALDSVREERQRCEDDLARKRAALARETAAARGRIEVLRSGLAERLRASDETVAAALADAERLVVELPSGGEKDGLPATLARYEQIEARLSEERERVATRMSALAEEIRGRLGELGRLLVGAPPEIAGEALGAAEAALDGRDHPTDLDLGRMERAVALLEEADQEARAFRDASARRVEAMDAAARVAKIRLPWRSARQIRRAVKSVEAEFGARRWAAATLASTALLEATSGIEAAQRIRDAARAEERTASEPQTSPQATADGSERGTRRAWTIAASSLLAVALAAMLVWRLGAGTPVPGPDSPADDNRVAAPLVPEAQPDGNQGVDERPNTIRDAPARDVPTGPVTAVRPPRAEPPPPPPLVRAFSPEAETVDVAEGTEREFRIVLSDPEPKSATIEWVLGDAIVARDTRAWTYRPDYDVAGEKILTLEARVAANGGASAWQRWSVRVTDTNRAPIVKTASPDPLRPLAFKPGTAVALRVDAADPDGDQLSYAWTVDGKAARATDAELRLEPRAAAGRVGVVVSDGQAEARTEWELAAIRPAPLDLPTTPRELAKLAFGKEQAFEVKPAGDAKLRITWQLDDRVVADGPRFVLRNYDADLVRTRPVELRARAETDDGRSFARTWKFSVIPPPPKISGTPAPGQPINLDPDRSQTFVVKADGLIGEQRARYTFVVDGKRAAQRGGERYVFQARDGRHRIEAFAEDQFGQRSASLTWEVAYELPLLTRAKAWLESLEDALNAKDVERIADLRGLDAAAKRELADALEDQVELKVRLGDPQFESVGPDRIVVRYERTDAFRDALSREEVGGSMRLETELGLENGRIRERRTRRR